MPGTETDSQPLLGRRSLPADRDAKAECRLGRQSMGNSWRKDRERLIREEAPCSVLWHLCR